MFVSRKVRSKLTSKVFTKVSLNNVWKWVLVLAEVSSNYFSEITVVCNRDLRKKGHNGQINLADMAWLNTWFEWTQFCLEGSFSPTDLEKSFGSVFWIHEFIFLLFGIQVLLQRLNPTSWIHFRYVSRSHGLFSHELILTEDHGGYFKKFLAWSDLLNSVFCQHVWLKNVLWEVSLFKKKPASQGFAQ